MGDVKGLCERLGAVRGLLGAQDDRQTKMHELLETIREQIRLGVPAEHRPDGLFKNIQDAVYGMRGRTPLLNDIAITSPVDEAATALTLAQARIRELEGAQAEKQAAIDAAYPAMKRALRLGQIDASKVADEHPERQKLRLDVFRALDMPTACLGGHASPEAARALKEAQP